MKVPIIHIILVQYCIYGICPNTNFTFFWWSHLDFTPFPIAVEPQPPLTPLPLPDLVPRHRGGRVGAEEEEEDDEIMPALRNGHDTTAAKVNKQLTNKNKQTT